MQTGSSQGAALGMQLGLREMPQRNANWVVRGVPHTHASWARELPQSQCKLGLRERQ
jgi:hypothetical protein